MLQPESLLKNTDKHRDKKQFTTVWENEQLKIKK